MKCFEGFLDYVLCGKLCCNGAFQDHISSKAPIILGGSTIEWQIYCHRSKHFYRSECHLVVGSLDSMRFECRCHCHCGVWSWERIHEMTLNCLSRMFAPQKGCNLQRRTQLGTNPKVPAKVYLSLIAPHVCFAFTRLEIKRAGKDPLPVFPIMRTWSVTFPTNPGSRANPVSNLSVATVAIHFALLRMLQAFGLGLWPASPQQGFVQRPQVSTS